MRKPERLYGFYEELKRIHITYFPDWRFGQLYNNFFHWLMSTKQKDSFYLEESKMIDYLREFTETLNS